MFFPEELKKITQPKDTDGFFYFNPEEEVESYLYDGEIDTEELNDDLKKQHKAFLIANAIIVLINIAVLWYWALKIDTIFAYKDSESEKAKSDTIGMLIMILMITQFVWVLNFLLGYNFFRYELNFGIICYFVVLNLGLFARIALNFFVVVANAKLSKVLGDQFNLNQYLCLVLVQGVGDIILIVLAAKMKFTIKKLDEVLDKKLYNEAISHIVLL